MPGLAEIIVLYVFLGLPIGAICAVCAFFLARERNRRRWRWVVASLLFNLGALLLLAVLPRADAPCATPAAIPIA